jgi:hypothetical protein
MKNYDSIEITKIVVHASMGAVLGRCIQSAIRLAADEWQNVELIHNARAYKVMVNDLFASVVGPESESGV